MTLGDLLAIRGLPSVMSTGSSKYMHLLSSAWLGMGLLFFALDVKMIMTWSLMTLWLGLVSMAQKQKVIA